MSPAPVSVIIPAYNSSAYLAEAMESTLNQTQPPAEVIVIDDGSTDSSPLLADSFGGSVKCRSIPHSGPGAARNRGVDQANCDLLAFLDADDLWMPDKLSKQIAALETTPKLDCALGNVENFIDPNLDEAGKKRLANAQKIMPGYHVGAMLIRRAAFLRFGYFNENLRAGEFIEWWDRALGMGMQYEILNEVVMRRRLHTNNLTRLHPENLRDYLKIAQAALVRQRRSQPL